MQDTCPLRCIASNATGFAKYLYLIAGLYIKSAEYLLSFLKHWTIAFLSFPLALKQDGNSEFLVGFWFFWRALAFFHCQTVFRKTKDSSIILREKMKLNAGHLSVVSAFVQLIVVVLTSNSQIDCWLLKMLNVFRWLSLFLGMKKKIIYISKL